MWFDNADDVHGVSVGTIAVEITGLCMLQDAPSEHDLDIYMKNRNMSSDCICAA